MMGYYGGLRLMSAINLNVFCLRGNSMVFITVYLKPDWDFSFFLPPAMIAMASFVSTTVLGILQVSML